MGASVNVYWPGITDEEISSGPYFRNDCKAWGDWMGRINNYPALRTRMIAHGYGPLLTLKTEGIKDEHVQWVTPNELAIAAEELASAIRRGEQLAGEILEVYKLRDPRPDMYKRFLRDLDDVRSIAQWAHSLGVEEITLEVEW